MHRRQTIKSASDPDTTLDSPCTPSAKDSSSPPSSAFECNVCFDTPNDPVVTPCGHLYCWSCLYKWMRVHVDNPQCPVCKSSVEKAKVIPIYGRGRTAQDDPRERPLPDEQLPPRPQGLRTETIHNANNPRMPDGSPFGIYPTPINGGRMNAYANYGSFSLSTFSLFPSLFGMQIAYPQLAEFQREQRLTPEQENQEQVARIFVLLVIFIIFCVVMF